MEPIQVAQTSSFGLYLGLGLAGVTLVQVLSLALINGWLGGRKETRDAAIKREEKQEEWRRQDVVAAQAAEAARLLLEAQRETIARTDKVARLTEQATRQTSAKLEQIHVLVNSEMTAARTAERDTQQLLVLALKHSLTLSQALGHPPDKQELDALAVAEERIVKLNKIILDRNEAQRLVDEEARRAGVILARRAEDQGADGTLKKIEENTAATVAALTEKP